MSDISLELDLNAQQLYQELQTVQTHFAQFAAKATQEGEKAGKGFGEGFSASRVGSEIAGKLKATLGALGIGFGAAAVVGEIKSIVEEAHNLHHEAERFGIDAEQLQILTNAAKQLGIPIESSARVLQFLTLSAAAATNASSKQAQSMDQLKIAAEGYINASPLERLFQISDAYQASSKNAKDYEAAVTLMGKKIGGEFIPVLLQGRQAILDNAAAMGLFSDETVKDLDRVYVSTARAKGQFDALAAVPISNFWVNLTGSLDEFIGRSKAAGTEAHGLYSALERLAHADLAGAKKALDDARSRADEFVEEGKRKGAELGFKDKFTGGPKESPEPKETVRPPPEPLEQEDPALDKQRKKIEEETRKLRAETLAPAEQESELIKQAAEIQKKIEGTKDKGDRATLIEEQVRIAEQLKAAEKSRVDQAERDQDALAKKERDATLARFSGVARMVELKKEEIALEEQIAKASNSHERNKLEEQRLDLVRQIEAAESKGSGDRLNNERAVTREHHSRGGGAGGGSGGGTGPGGVPSLGEQAAAENKARVEAIQRAATGRAQERDIATRRGDRGAGTPDYDEQGNRVARPEGLTSSGLTTGHVEGSSLLKDGGKSFDEFFHPDRVRALKEAQDRKSDAGKELKLPETNVILKQIEQNTKGIGVNQ